MMCADINVKKCNAFKTKKKKNKNKLPRATLCLMSLDDLSHKTFASNHCCTQKEFWDHKGRYLPGQELEFSIDPYGGMRN